MKAYIFCRPLEEVKQGVTQRQALITWDGDITALNVDRVIGEVKNKHRIPGKDFIIITSAGTIFRVVKQRKTWIKFELERPKEENEEL